MAKFDPFAKNGERRLPTATERDLGFPLGPADQQLFNGIIHRIEAELGNLITHAGLTPTDDRFTQVREAVLAMIAAATGGGDPSAYLLLSQARARLPIFPETQTVDNKLGVTTLSAGTVRVPGGVTVLHRGVFPIVTAQQDFATDASKTYHVRQASDGTFTLKDLASGVYNAGSDPETDPAFDSTYDDVLHARVVTNSSNIATITNLRNASRLIGTATNAAAMTNNPSANSANRTAVDVFDLARTPQASVTVEDVDVVSGADVDIQITPTVDRYRVSTFLKWDFASAISVRTNVIA